MLWKGGGGGVSSEYVRRIGRREWKRRSEEIVEANLVKKSKFTATKRIYIKDEEQPSIWKTRSKEYEEERGNEQPSMEDEEAYMNI
jgi:hypothetical protein